MLVSTKAIVLSAIKFQEKSLVVKCFTQSDGLKTYFVRDAFSKQKQSQRMAYFLPMTILEIEAVHKNKGTMETFSEIKVFVPFVELHTNVAKSSIVLFLSEILQQAIKEEEKNELFFGFLETALLWLDGHSDTVNFHLIMLLEIAKYFGFYPDISEIEFDFFDSKNGIFVPFETSESMNREQTRLFKKLLDLKLSNNQKIFNVQERQLLLTVMMDYYALHLAGFRKPKSIEILKMVFE